MHFGRDVRSGRRALSLLMLLLPVVMAVSAAWVFDRPGAGTSVFRLSNLVGPTTRSLLAGGGLTTCTEAMGTPGNPICFHAGRMPLASLVVGLGVELFGDHALRVGIFKAVLLLLPLELAISLVWSSLVEELRTAWRRGAVALLLLAPFGMMPFLADVVNLQVEEAYSYSLLALAVAILFFSQRDQAQSRPETWTDVPVAATFGLTVAALYLAKSSMLPVAFVLTVALALRVRSRAARWVAIVLVSLGPLGWAMHQAHASGRPSIGTSLDGLNLHKGNAEGFLLRYPPAGGATLDGFDAVLNRGQAFGDEWSFNDFHQRAALAYMRAHPGETIEADGRKLAVLLLSLRKVGSGETHGFMLLAETAGLVGFRLLLWGAIGGAVVTLFRSGAANAHPRWEAAVFLLLVAVCSLPYVLGFAYTRHASVLIYPAALMCCRLLGERADTGAEPARNVSGGGR